MPPTNTKQRYSAIPLRILLYIAWRNLVHKKLRAFLTMLGIVIGIGAIFFLLSLGIGLQNLVTDQVIGNQSIKSIDVTTPNSRILKLNEANVEKIRGFGHVETLGASFSFAGSMQLAGSEVDSVVYGVDEAYQKLMNLNLVAGRLINKDDFRHAVINVAGTESIGLKDSASAVGSRVELVIPIQDKDGKAHEINEEFEIVGVIDSGSGGELFLPNFVFESAGVPNYTQVKLVADDLENVGDIRASIESLGFATTSPIDTIDQINQVFRFFNVMLAGFGAIGMFVAVLGMFNTLTISLLERTKEIGLMMALGARNSDMRKLFIFEAVLLSLVGAAVGIILAFLFGRVVNALMNRFAEGRGVTEGFNIFATPPLLILGLLGFMVLVGMAVVFFPARRAEKINPIDALRRE